MQPNIAGNFPVLEAVVAELTKPSIAAEFESEVKGAKSELDVLAHWVTGRATSVGADIQSLTNPAPEVDYLSMMEGNLSELNSTKYAMEEEDTQNVTSQIEGIQNKQKDAIEGEGGLLSDLQAVKNAASPQSYENDRRLAEQTLNGADAEYNGLSKQIDTDFGPSGAVTGGHHVKKKAVSRIQGEIIDLMEKARVKLADVTDKGVMDTLEKMDVEFKDEKNARKSSEAALKTQRETILKNLEDLGKDIATGVNDQLRKMDQAASYASMGRMTEVRKDMGKYAQEQGVASSGLKAEGRELARDLQIRASAGDSKVKATQQELANHLADERAWPATVDALIADLQDFTSMTFATLRDEREGRLQALTSSYGDQVNEEIHEVIRHLRGVSNTIVDHALKLVLASNVRARNMVDPAVRRVGMLDTEAKAHADTITDGVKRVTENAQRLERVGLRADKTAKDVNEAIYNADEHIKSLVQKVVVPQSAGMESQNKGLDRAWSDGNKTLQRLKRATEDSFRGEFDKAERGIRYDLDNAEGEMNRIKGIGTSMLKGMNAKNLGLQERVSEIMEDFLPKLHDAVDDFISHAERRVDTQVPLDLEKEVREAKGVIGVHADRLKGVSDTQLANLAGEVGPRVDAILKQITGTGVELDKRLTQANESQVDTIDKTGGMLENIKKKWNVNEDMMHDATTSLPEYEQEAAEEMRVQGDKLDEFAHQQKSAVNTMHAEAEVKIESAEGRLRSQLVDAEHATRGVIGGAHGRASETAAESLKNILRETTRVTDPVLGKTHTLKERSLKLKSLMDEVSAATENAKKAGNAALQTSTRAVSGADGAALRAGDAVAQARAQGAEALASGEASRLRGFETQMTSAAGSAEAEVKQEETAAAGQLQGGEETAEAGVRATAAEASGEIGAAEASVKAAERGLQRVDLSREQMDHELESRFQAAQAKADAASAAFTAQVAAFGAQLGNLAAEEQQQAQDLRNYIGLAGGAVNGRLVQVSGGDKRHITELQTFLAKNQKEVDSKGKVLEAAVDSFRVDIAQLKKKAATAVRNSKAQTAEYERALNSANERFNTRLQAEQKSRLKGTDDMLQATQEGLRLLNGALESNGMLAAKVQGALKNKLGSMQLAETRIADDLGKALELQKYSDAGAVDKVLEKLTKVKEQNKLFDTWKTKAQKGTDKFREIVQDEFKSLGSELDLASVAAAEEEAMEEWAVQEQMRSLRRQLGAELRNMSSLAESRLADLARTSGAQLAALHRNRTLTDAERAAAIAKVTAMQRERARAIMEEDQSLALEQSTAARNINLAMAEVERSAKQLAQLESGKGTHYVGGGGVDATLDRVRTIVTYANELAEAGPKEYMDSNSTNQTGAAAAALLQVQTPTRALRSEADQDLFSEEQAAAARARAALGQDAEWRSLLDRLT